MTFAQFREINSVRITDYSVYNRTGVLVDWFTINSDWFTISYFDDDGTESLKKAVKWENAEVSDIHVFNDVLRVTLTVDSI